MKRSVALKQRMQDKQAHVDFKRAEMALQRAVNRLNVSDMSKKIRKGPCLYGFFCLFYGEFYKTGIIILMLV